LARITVSSDYTNTKALLAEYGYTITPDYSDVIESIKNDGTYVRILSSDDYKNETGVDFVSSLYRYGTEKTAYRYVTECSDEFLTIFEAAKPMYITDKSCYTIDVGGSFYVIPEDYSAEAEKVYSSASVIEDAWYPQYYGFAD
jgi:hypothetical protein